MTRTPETPGTASFSTGIGLGIALLGPPLSQGFTSALYGSEQSAARLGIGLAVHWLNLAAIILIVVAWERRPLGSIGLRPLRWPTIPLGCAAGLAIVLASPLIGRLNHALGLESDRSLVAFLMTMPVGLRVLLVLTAGIFEETLYRGYALERLAQWTGSKWAAAGITVAAFALAHVPAVGFAHLLPVFVVSVLVTLLYLWKRDLVLNMVAHAVVDGIALLVIPALTRPGGP